MTVAVSLMEYPKMTLEAPQRRDYSQHMARTGIVDEWCMRSAALSYVQRFVVVIQCLDRTRVERCRYCGTDWLL